MPPKSQKQTFWTAFKAASYETTDDESDEEAERESTTSSAEEQKKISRGMHDWMFTSLPTTVNKIAEPFRATNYNVQLSTALALLA